MPFPRICLRQCFHGELAYFTVTILTDHSYPLHASCYSRLVHLSRHHLQQTRHRMMSPCYRRLWCTLAIPIRFAGEVPWDVSRIAQWTEGAWGGSWPVKVRRINGTPAHFPDVRVRLPSDTSRLVKGVDVLPWVLAPLMGPEEYDIEVSYHLLLGLY